MAFCFVWQREQEWTRSLECDVFKILLIAAGFVLPFRWLLCTQKGKMLVFDWNPRRGHSTQSTVLSHVFSVRRLQITIDVPLSSACSSNLGPRARCQWQCYVCHPPILGDMLHSTFINKMVQGGNIICPWNMFKHLPWIGLTIFNRWFKPVEEFWKTELAEPRICG